MAAEYLVSACLAGEECRYDGCANLKMQVKRWVKEGKAVPFCPEVAGGLPVPRVGAERRGDKVITRNGEDVTDNFYRGACQGLALARSLGIEKAFLAIHSPSCGSGLIYDGSFSRRLVSGKGVFAELLDKNGIEVLTPPDHEIIQVISRALIPISKSGEVGYWGRPWGKKTQGQFFGSHHLLGDQNSVVDICQHRSTGRVVVTEYGRVTLGEKVRDVLKQAGLLELITDWHST